MQKRILRFIQDNYRFISKILDIIFGINSLMALIIVVLIAGFYLDDAETQLLAQLIDFTIIVFIAQEFLRWIIELAKEKNKREHRLKERILAILLLTSFIWRDTILGFFVSMLPQVSIVDITFIYLGILQISIIASYVVDLLRNTNISRIKIHPGAITALSFALVILIGSLLLYLPKATPQYHPISYSNALFIATSSVCVTGLTTVNIGETFTPTGKVIMLLLIQIGGIGVMTLSSFLTAVLLGGLSFRMNVMLREILSEDNLSEISSLLKRISIFTLAIEFFGAIAIYLSLNSGHLFTLDLDKAGAAIFHSIASFCNAGLSIYSKNMIDPLIYHNYWFLTFVMVLIFIGGIGFLAFSNLYGYIISKYSNKKSRIIKPMFRLSITTKLIFAVSLIMIVGGSLLIFLTEQYPSESGLTLIGKLFYSVFMTISAKTAGFDIVGVNTIGSFSILVIVVVMWIGGSPGSTAGGIKNTTFGVLVLHFINYLRGRDNLHFAHRRIDTLSIQKAQMVFFSTICVTILSILLLILLEPNINPMALAFEAISAVSTTGLTLGITDKLGTAGKYIIIFTMYIGRIGVLTFLFAFFKHRERLSYEYPDEKVIVG